MALLILLLAFVGTAHGVHADHRAGQHSPRAEYGACTSASIQAGVAPTAIKIVIHCKAPARGDSVGPIIGGVLLVGGKVREGGIVAFRRRPVLRGRSVGSRFGRCVRYFRQISCGAKLDGPTRLIEVLHVRASSRCRFKIGITEFEHSRCDTRYGCPTSAEIRLVAHGRPRGCA